MSQERFLSVTLRQNPGSAVGWKLMGDLDRKRGDFGLAERAYRRAFELRDGAGFFFPEAHTNHAQMLLRRGDRSGAEAEYRKVLEERPNQYTALANLGEMLLRDDRTRAKAESFEANGILAQALRLEGRFEEALRAVERALLLRPNDPDLWELRPQVLSASGRDAEAAEATARAARLRAR